MSTRLSEAPGNPPQPWLGRHIPFTAYIRVIPIKGKRFETYRDLEKESDRVLDALQNICSSDDLVVDIANPVAFTPKFGDKHARLTITGHACFRDTFAKEPVGEHLVINCGEYKSGTGASNNANRVPDSEVDALANELKLQIESATVTEVTRIEVARVIYGEGGLHFN